MNIKPILLLLTFSVLNQEMKSQTETCNYVESVFYLNEIREDSVVQVQYYDEMGRESLLVSGGLNTSGKFVYSHSEYDCLDRLCKKSATVIGSSNPSHMSSSQILNTLSFMYPGETNNYSNYTYDVMDRTTFVSSIGNSWRGKGKRTIYRSNEADEVYMYSSTNIFSPSYYAAHTLYCTEMIDEDEVKTIRFKDFQDRLILDRRVNNGQNLDTYYVYDDYDRLAYVLPPMYNISPSASNLARYAYQYRYDRFGRMWSKKLPGCSPATFLYDDADRIIGMQDSILFSQAKIRVYKYDEHNRLLKQSMSHCGNILYDEIVNYYDDYLFLDSIFNLNETTRNLITPENMGRGRGHQTGMLQRASNGEDLISVYGYDDYGRVIMHSEIGLEGILTKTCYEYNFAGDVALERTQTYNHQADGSREMILEVETITNYQALHTKLPTSTLLIINQFNNGTMRSDTTILMQPTYDDYGHVVVNDRSGTAGDMSYTYDNLHGWIESIESVGGFEQRLYRELGGSRHYYNGSIAAMSWKDPQSGMLRRYDYHYDDQNRLLDAIYNESSTGLGVNAIGDPISMIPSTSGFSAYNKYSERVTYDANSNICTLQRYGMLNDRSYGLIDDIDVSYDGNRRVQATDAVSSQLNYTGASDFVDKQHVGAEYEYNANGALTKDLNRGITNIEYDLLGNPKIITMTNNRSIQYVYSADGRRLRTVHSRLHLAEVGPLPFEGGTAGTLNTVSSIAGVSGVSDLIRPGGPIGPIDLVSGIDSTDYFGRFVFHNSHPHQYHFDGGYISFSADTVDGFHYYIQDYMGNNRMVVNGRTDSIEQVTHYYPYGGVIGDISTNESLQKFKFEGMELDRTFGLDNYDIEARQYFAMAPMWDRVDPLAEKYYGISPYAYCAGDPINNVDVDGLDVYKVNNFGYVVKSDRCLGTYLLFVSTTGTYYNTVELSSYENSYDEVLDGLQNEANTYNLMSIDQALTLQNVMTQNTSVEWKAECTKNGTGLLVTSHDEQRVNSDKARTEYGIENKDIIIQIHGHPGRNSKDGSASEGTRGGSDPDRVCIERFSATRFFVNHQGSGHIYEYDASHQCVREWDSFEEWRNDVVGQ